MGGPKFSFVLFESLSYAGFVITEFECILIMPNNVWKKII